MFVFFVAAIGEVIVGVLVYEFLDPQKARSMRKKYRGDVGSKKKYRGDVGSKATY